MANTSTTTHKHVPQYKTQYAILASSFFSVIICVVAAAAAEFRICFAHQQTPYLAGPLEITPSYINSLANFFLHHL
jgi:hypothetical protein